MVVLPLVKLVTSSSYTRCVRPSDPSNGIGASSTSPTMGVNAWMSSVGERPSLT